MRAPMTRTQEQVTPGRSQAPRAERAVIGEAMKCGRCGDVIGIYEPVVLLSDGRARMTSAAAEPGVREAPGERFHRACCADQPAASA
jgi:hypothetical protein